MTAKNANRRRATLLFSLAVAICLAALVLPIAEADLYQRSASALQPVIISQSPPAGTYFDHLVFIIMENEGIGDICGGNPPPCSGTDTPYMSALANQYGIDQQYLRVGAGTSQPQYIAIMAASQQNCTTGCGTSGNLHALNLVDRFESAGLTWKAYMEDQGVASGCVSSDTGFYSAIHNPFVSFNDIFTNPTRCNNIVLANPSSCGSTVDCPLINDLNSGSAPNFMWLTPNNCDNMHAQSGCSNGCTSGGSTTCFRDGDNYLKSVVNNILNSTTFKTTNSALFITFDEGNGSCPLNGSSEDCLYNVWAGSPAKTSYTNTTLFNHYSFTKTIETNWSLSTMTSNDASATPMTAFLKAQTSPDFSISASPTSINVLASAQASSTITLNSLNSFAGTVTLAASSSPTGPTLNLNPTIVALTPGGSGTSTLTVTTSTTGNYTITVTGTSGLLQHTTTVTVHVQDYSISSNPASIKTNSGTQGSSTITVSPINHFTGTVSLSATGTTGLTVGISPTSISGGFGTATLTASASTTGNYTATITSTSGILNHMVTVNVQVVGFTITATSPSPVNAGVSASSTITVTAVNHFTGTVTLTDSIPSGLTCGSITPGSISGSGTATVSCNATTFGNYTLTITGTSGSLTHTATALFQVRDYTVTANPTTVTANVGTTATSTITVTGQNGFVSPVTLSTNSTSCSLNPTSVTGTGSSTLSCTFSSTGTFHVGVTGTSGTLSHTVTLTFKIQNFTLTANPTSITVNAGSQANSTITVSSVNGFAGIVNLTTNSTLCSLNPTSVTGSGSSTLSCTFTSASTFHVNVTGTNGSLSHTVTLTFTIQDFTLTASPSTVNANANASGMSTITLSPLNGFIGIVTLATNSTSCTVSPNSLTGSGTSTLTCTFTTSGTRHVAVTGTNGNLSHNTTLTFKIQDFTIIASPTSLTLNVNAPGNSTISITALNGFNGVVNLATNSTSCTLSKASVAGSGSTTLSCTFTTTGNFHVAVTATSASLSHSTTVTYTVQDFNITASPTSININANATGKSTIIITPTNSFASLVSLTTNSTACTLNPTSLTGSGSSTLSCTFTSASTVSVKITGTSSNLSHSATVTFTVQDFTITATSPSPANVGNSLSTTITLNSLDQFAATISLTDTVPAGLSCGTVSPSSVSGSGTATLSCTSSTAGNYTVTITGTSSNLIHSTSSTFRYQDYTITATTPSIVNAHATVSATLTIGSLNGFNATVNLSDSIPSGLTCSTISPSTLTGSGTAGVSCSAMTGGNYTLTMTGTSASLTHSTTTTFRFADFTITATNPPATDIERNINSIITVSAINQFSTTVSLSTSVTIGVFCDPPSPTSLPGSGSSTLTCTTTTSGNYTVQVRGAAGNISHMTTITIQAIDYTISSNPTVLTTPVATNATSTLTLTSLNGYSGNITMIPSVQIQSTTSGPGGVGGGPPLRMTAPGQMPDPIITPGSLILSSAGTGHATLTIIVPTGTQAGNYTIIITANDGTLFHTIQLTLTVTDFSLTTPTTNIIQAPGTNSTTTLSLQSLNSFQGNVTLSTSISPSGPTATVNPSQIFLTSNSSTMLTVTVPSSTPLGNYTLTVQASSGSLVHTISIRITVKIGPTSILVKMLSPGTSVPAGIGAVLALLCIITIQAVKKERANAFKPKRKLFQGRRSYNNKTRWVQTSNLLPPGPVWTRLERS